MLPKWRHVGVLRLRGDDPVGALAAWDRAGDDARALALAAALREQRGDPEARATWIRLTEVDPHDPAGWRGVARLSDEPMPWLDRALASDPCDVPTRLERASVVPPCASIQELELAWDAAPRDPDVLYGLAAAYHACGVQRRTQGSDVLDSLEGLRTVEWTWRTLGDEAAASQTATLRRELEGG